MSTLKTWITRLHATFFPGRHESHIAAECEAHLTDLAAGHEARGLDPANARLAARRDFGPLEAMKESYRDRAVFTTLSNLGRDLAYAARSLRQTPAFTSVAVASLALGIGANTAIFSLIDTILLQHLPVPGADRLMVVNQDDAPASLRMNTLEALARRNDVFDGLLGTFPTTLSVSSGETEEWVAAEIVTGEYFRTLQVQPALGRLFDEKDVQAAGGDPVCVISYSLWQRRFNGARGVLDQTLVINSHRYRILGVTAAGFHGSALHGHAEMEVPVTRIADFMPMFASATGLNWRTSLSWLSAMGRLKPGFTRQAAQIRLQKLSDDIQRPLSKQDRILLTLGPGERGFDTAQRAYGKPALVLLGVVVVVLLAACVNLANLLLARGQSRSREFAIRLAVGGSRSRLFQQLMIENFLLCLAGVVTGAAVAFVLARTVLAQISSSEARGAVYEVHPDLVLVLFTVTVAFATVILFGLVPALQSIKTQIVPELKEGSIANGGVFRMFFRKSLVVLQLMLSMVLLLGASLLTRTLSRLQTVDLGYEPASVVTMEVNPIANGHSDAEATHIYQEILERTRQLSGIRRASLAAYSPLSDGAISLSIAVPGYTPKSQEEVTPNFNFVTADYFATLQQPLLAGRDFNSRDVEGAPRVAIVNQHFARHFFGRKSPIGRRFEQGGSSLEIVGVVRDAHEFSVRDAAADMVYASIDQGQSSSLTLLVQVGQTPQSVIPMLRGLVRSIDKHMPILRIQTLAVTIDGQLTTARLLSYLSTLFAALAALLAAIGFYGVISYNVSRRRKELGIRFALGATRTDVADLFLRESLTLIALGLALGIPCALAAVQSLRAVLFGLTTLDLPSLLFSVMLLLLAAGFAIVIPLWRASHVDPVQALRHE